MYVYEFDSREIGLDCNEDKRPSAWDKGLVHERRGSRSPLQLIAIPVSLLRLRVHLVK